MSITAAVSFGSFGDIVTIVQLVSQLCDALNDVSGAPAEIEALSADMNGYKLVLTLVEDVLLHRDVHFDSLIRATIEGALRRCKMTLHSIQRHVDAFSLLLEPRAGRHVMLAYLSAVRWRLFAGRREVAALHARLDKQLSLVQICLGVSQSNAQCALQFTAERNVAISEQILLLAQTRPRQIDAGAAVLHVYDYDLNSVYPAFAVVPVYMLSKYLEPLTDLVDPDAYRVFMYGNRREVILRGRHFPKRAGSITGGAILLRHKSPFDGGVVFQCNVFTSGSGERHALLGIPPSEYQDVVTRVLSDVLHWEFVDNVNAGLYEAERNADFIRGIVESYDRIVNLAQRFAGRKAVQPILRCLEGFPNITWLMDSPMIQHLETLLRRPHYLVSYGEALSAEESISNLPGVLHWAPRITEDELTKEQRHGMMWALRSPSRPYTDCAQGPVAQIFRALAYRERGARQLPWPAFCRPTDDDAE